METLSNSEIADAGLDDWRKLAQALHARFTTPDHATGAAFVAAVAELADSGGHLPDVHLSRGVVDVSICTRESGRWVTQDDIEFARRVSGLARERGLTPEPGTVTQLELGLDTWHDDVVGPFWSALLTGSPHNTVHDSVFDPDDRVPSVWFQGTDEHETPRQRWHVDLWLAPEVADERVAAALAAGGVVVDDSAAPSFTVLADPDGNRVCICTSLDR